MRSSWITAHLSSLSRPARYLRAFALLLPVTLNAQRPHPEPPTYFEFGTVIALGTRSVDLQVFDEKRQRSVHHSFLLTRDTRADLVHLGDQVEVIFTAEGTEYTLRRLMALNSGIPAAGLPGGVPNSEGRPSPDSKTSPASPALAASARSANPPPRRADAKVVPKITPIAPLHTAPTHDAPAPAAIALGAKAPATAASVVNVPLGVAAESTARIPKVKAVATHDTPSEECNRSSADWPGQPISLAVLDFRYPTEQEEAHGETTTGGGSGTALADLVFDRLEKAQEFALSRGDRSRLYKADFAGAARIGRQLGVDAVLAGTFVPIVDPQAEPGTPPRAYQLSAGVVDTCTGQLLIKLSSNTCPLGDAACTPQAVSAKQAANPAVAARAFEAPLEALLFPLEHNGKAGQSGAAGKVIDVTQGVITLQTPAGLHLKAGDQLAIHASRISKNPTTYTLQNLRDQEIGRMTLERTQGSTAVGRYQGDVPAKPGDTAEAVPDAR